MRHHDDPPGGRHDVHQLFPGVLAMVLMAACARPSAEFKPERIIALERGALDRWGKGDPTGYYEIMSPDMTYFDPTTEKRIDGVAALKALIAPFEGKIRIDSFEMVNPTVLRDGDMAILAFNLISHGAQVNGGKKGDVRWNSTEVYRRIEGAWKIVHSHWSYVRPHLQEQPAE